MSLALWLGEDRKCSAAVVGLDLLLGLSIVRRCSLNRSFNRRFRLPFRRFRHESRILAGYYGFNASISFTFQAIKNLYAHPTYLCFGPFCKFLGDF